MALTLALLLLGPGSPSSYQAQLGGKDIGTVRLTQKITPEGDKTVELITNIQQGTERISVRSFSRFDAQGNPTRKLFEVGPTGSAATRQVIATFTKEGASVVTRVDGKSRTQQFPLVAGAPRANLSEFWFVRDHPDAGTKLRFYAFNPEALAWQLTEVEYRGANRVHTTIGDRTVDSLIDSTGTLVSLQDSTGLRLWRLNPGQTGSGG